MQYISYIPYVHTLMDYNDVNASWLMQFIIAI